MDIHDAVRRVEGLPRCSKAAVMVVALILATPGEGAAQEPPRVSLLAGFGNAFGWFGGQVEAYLGDGRLSGFAGLGYMPNIPKLLTDEGDGVAGAVGIRAFTAGTRHRGLVELSLSALSINVRSTFEGEVLEKDINYGPGIAVGYQFIGDGGFTMMLTGGVALDDNEFDPEGSNLQLTLGIGLGYSWR